MSAPAMLQRPIFGGVFGMGRYALATTPCISNGLHAVRFMVIEPRAGSVLSIAEDKREALAGARRLLRAADAEPSEADSWRQSTLWRPDELEPVDARGVPVRTVSRRRREIYEKCGGRCHYCSAPLHLAGPWHVEHMVPRALHGDDQPINLVAACGDCNLAKSDRTALEFVVQSMAILPDRA